PHDHNGLRPLALAHRLVRDHRAARLLGVGAAADLQMVGGLGQAQVLKERVGHIRVVMLAGVHDVSRAPVFTREGVIQRRHLHEVRARGGDQVDWFGAQAVLPQRAWGAQAYPIGSVGSAESLSRIGTGMNSTLAVRCLREETLAAGQLGRYLPPLSYRTGCNPWRFGKTRMQEPYPHRRRARRPHPDLSLTDRAPSRMHASWRRRTSRR